MPNSVALLALSAGDALVVATSISLVFAMLVALCFIVTGEGKIFDAIAAQKEAKKRRQLEAVRQSMTAPALDHLVEPAAPAPAPAPVVEEGIPGDIVAAIAAAVCYLEGENATVSGIRRLPAARGHRRGVWGDAGVAQNVRPF